MKEGKGENNVIIVLFTDDIIELVVIIPNEEIEGENANGDNNPNGDNKPKKDNAKGENANGNDPDEDEPQENLNAPAA